MAGRFARFFQAVIAPLLCCSPIRRPEASENERPRHNQKEEKPPHVPAMKINFSGEADAGDGNQKQKSDPPKPTPKLTSAPTTTRSEEAPVRHAKGIITTAKLSDNFPFGPALGPKVAFWEQKLAARKGCPNIKQTVQVRRCERGDVKRLVEKFHREGPGISYPQGECKVKFSEKADVRNLVKFFEGGA